MEKVESVYQKVELLAQIWVYGNSMESNLIAVVVPEEQPFLEFAKQKGFSGSLKDLANKPELKKAVLDEMNKVAKQAKLRVRPSHLHRLLKYRVFCRPSPAAIQWLAP